MMFSYVKLGEEIVAVLCVIGFAFGAAVGTFVSFALGRKIKFFVDGAGGAIGVFLAIVLSVLIENPYGDLIGYLGTLPGSVKTVFRLGLLLACWAFGIVFARLASAGLASALKRNG